MNAVANATPDGWESIVVAELTLGALGRRAYVDRFGGRMEGTVRGIRGSIDGKGDTTIIVELHLVDGSRVSLPLKPTDVIARYIGPVVTERGPAAEVDPLAGA